MRIRTRVISSFLLLTGLLPVTAYTEGILSVEPAWIKWRDTVFEYGNNRLEFSDDYQASILAVDFTYRYENNFAVSGEYIFADQNIDKNTNLTSGMPELLNGYANVYHYNIYGKYFFGNNSNFMPYAGLGLGRTKVSIHSIPNIVMFGLSYNATVGCVIPLGELFAISLEYKKTYLDVDNEYGFRFKNHADIMQVGLSLLL